MRPILSQHGSQEGPQEASKINYKTVKNLLSFGLALGRPSGPQKVSKNGHKIIQNHPNQVPSSCVFLWLLRQLFITRFHTFLKLNALPVHLLRQVRNRARARACKPWPIGFERRLADSSFAVFLALSFEVVSWTVS